MQYLDFEREYYCFSDYEGVVIMGRDNEDDKKILFVIDGDDDYYYCFDDGMEKIEFPEFPFDDDGYWFTLVRKEFPDHDIIYGIETIDDLEININSTK